MQLKEGQICLGSWHEDNWSIVVRRTLTTGTAHDVTTMTLEIKSTWLQTFDNCEAEGSCIDNEIGYNP